MKKILLLISLLFCFTLSYAGLSVTPSITNISGGPNSGIFGKKYLR